MRTLIQDINHLREAIDLGLNDVFDFAKKNGYALKKQNMFFRKQTIPVITLTKIEKIGELEIVCQYVINPETESWLFQVCIEGQSAEDMVEFKKGEAYDTLLKHMQRKNKITANQAVNYLNPPVGVDVKKEIKDEQ